MRWVFRPAHPATARDVAGTPLLPVTATLPLCSRIQCDRYRRCLPILPLSKFTPHPSRYTRSSREQFINRCRGRRCSVGVFVTAAPSSWLSPPSVRSVVKNSSQFLLFDLGANEVLKPVTFYAAITLKFAVTPPPSRRRCTSIYCAISDCGAVHPSLPGTKS